MNAVSLWGLLHGWDIGTSYERESILTARSCRSSSSPQDPCQVLVAVAVAVAGVGPATVRQCGVHDGGQLCPQLPVVPGSWSRGSVIPV